MLVLTPLLLVCCYKPSISTATISELESIDGLGEELSYRVVVYLGEHENADIDDLLNVEGIGEKKLELIKRRYK